jgi:hypothetical protein
MPSNRARISIERISTSNLILSDLALKNKLIYQNTIGLASIKSFVFLYTGARYSLIIS